MEVVSLVMLCLYGGGLALAGGIALARQNTRYRLKRRIDPPLRRIWRAAAGHLQWSAVEESRPVADPPWLTGRAGELEVRLERSWLETTPCTRIVVKGLGHGREGLAVRRRDERAGREKRLFEREVELGVPTFDQPFRVVGSASLALAVLNRETRSILGELLLGKLAVEGQRTLEASGFLAADSLEVRVPHDAALSEKALRERIDGALASVLHLARSLAAPPDPAGRLAANFATEPEAEVRLRTLRQLLREHSEDPRRSEVARAALTDESDEVRLEAAIACGREGHETLRALVGRPETSELVAALAVEALGVFWSVEAATEGLRAALRRRWSEVARACLDTLGRHGRLGRRGGAEVESLVIRTLASRDTAVAVTAAEALGQLGSATAVPPLRELEEHENRELSRAARQAIAEIQLRLTGAEHGQLSLASSEAGALSLAEDGEAGRLSLHEPVPEER